MKEILSQVIENQSLTKLTLSPRTRPFSGPPGG